MEYTLTRHAVDVLEKRQIQLEWLESALQMPQRCEPDKFDPALEHRLATIPAFGNRVLRVIVNVRVFPERVITAYFDRGMRGKL